MDLDKNIKKVETVDFTDENNNFEIGILLTIKKSSELLFTTQQLQFLIEKIEKEKQYLKDNGVPSYVD